MGRIRIRAPPAAASGAAAGADDLGELDSFERVAYKSIDAVMEAQKDLVEIVHTLRQVVCVKG